MSGIGPLELAALLFVIGVIGLSAWGVIALMKASSPRSPRVPPPGWYPDPAGGEGYRWWDGQRWGAHRPADGSTEQPPER